MFRFRGCLVIVFLWLIAFNSGASAYHTQRLPPQGVFDNCNVGTDLTQCEQRVQRLGEAGFQLQMVGGALNGDLPTTLQYAATSARSGVRNIWPLTEVGWWQGYDPNGTDMLTRYNLITDCPDCRTNEDVLRFIVGSLKGRSTWGYYIADDSQILPGRMSRYLPGLRAFTARIHRIDPNARTIISSYVLNGNSGKELARYRGAADVILQEDYPIWSNTLGTGKLRRQVTQTSMAMARGARPGLATGAILQSWAWSEAYCGPSLPPSRFPNLKELEVLRDITVRYHPAIIMWFTATQVLGWPEGQADPCWMNIDPIEAERRWRNLQIAVFRTLPPVAIKSPVKAMAP